MERPPTEGPSDILTRMEHPLKNRSTVTERPRWHLDSKWAVCSSTLPKWPKKCSKCHKETIWQLVIRPRQTVAFHPWVTLWYNFVWWYFTHKLWHFVPMGATSCPCVFVWVHQPMDQCAVSPNLTQPWIWSVRQSRRPPTHRSVSRVP